MSGKNATPTPRGLPIIHARAAGIDSGSRLQVAAVTPDLSDEPVRTVHAFTSDLPRMADWLIDTGITTVAMESTGGVLGRRLRGAGIPRPRCHGRECARRARSPRQKA